MLRRFVTGRSARVDFEWDAAKAASNGRKHGVGFDEAAAVFADPRVWIRPDDVHSWSEDRWLATGRASDGRIVTVSYTMKGETIRLISAWRSPPRDRRAYDQDDRPD